MATDRPTIHWTRPMLERFKKEYDKHKDAPGSSFEFDGHVVLVGYAKYLIEYLETVKSLPKESEDGTA